MDQRIAVRADEALRPVVVEGAATPGPTMSGVVREALRRLRGALDPSATVGAPWRIRLPDRNWRADRAPAHLRRPPGPA